MPSEGGPTLPRMGSFKRSFLGYRRAEVDAAIAARDTRILKLEVEIPKIAELERELTSVSGMVLERERQVSDLRDELRAANERHERSLASLESISGRLEEIQAQARGQATRIRMKALREAVEVSRRVQELNEAEARDAGTPAAGTTRNGGGSGQVPDFNGIFEGLVKLEIGPLGDFSQLVGFEDAV